MLAEQFAFELQPLDHEDQIHLMNELGIRDFTFLLRPRTGPVDEEQELIDRAVKKLIEQRFLLFDEVAYTLHFA